ncbi:hypothetical protein HAX54_051586 [Datura stramonium]|uniref:Uncharacterized protein n=1 Tax=Datura stramonium TaxID=4076 RepID=A0ABS8WRI9_DATST|nr:hypothetical protein [Datura stramonium]
MSVPPYQRCPDLEKFDEYLAFEEPLDDDEATVLTDGVDDLDIDEEDAATGAMQVDGKDDDADEDEEYNLEDDA